MHHFVTTAIEWRKNTRSMFTAVLAVAAGGGGGVVVVCTAGCSCLASLLGQMGNLDC